MARCKHKSTSGWEYRERGLPEYARCLDCGHWLSLGPARDDGPHAAQVAIEKRAAELANMDVRPKQPHDGWQFGWWLHSDEEEAQINKPHPSLCALEDGTVYTAGYLEHHPGWHAGYLARVIATHDQETP
jgi:hypothetical protein